MDSGIKIIIASPPKLIRGAFSLGLPMAHMAYRVGQDMRLYRSELFHNTRGGLLVVDDVGFNGGGSSGNLLREVYNECVSHDFSGVVLNFCETCPQILTDFIREFSKTYADKLSIYVPESLASYAPESIVLISTAISGGTLDERVREALSRYGRKRVSIDIERVCSDFTLPAYTGEGVPLNQKTLSVLREKYRPNSFFSEELCANYFTYQEKGNTHFVLYDNGASIHSKLAVAEKAGVESAFLYYPEIADIAAEVLA